MAVDEIKLLATFAKSLGIGLLIGLEREGHVEAKAGLRTFALIALSGSLFALLGEIAQLPWLLGVGAGVVGAMLVSAYATDRDRTDPGTTTVIAALVTFALGAILWYGYTTLAVSLAVATTALLYFRSELHGVSQQLTRRDYVSFLQFAVLAFIVLPILPDRNFGPFSTFNPYRTGMLVILIAGISLGGYVALRFFGERGGALLAGIFGGIASTTATSWAYSRQVRHDPAHTALAARIVLIANLVLYARISVFVLVLTPGLMKLLGPVIAGGLLGGGGFLYWLTRRQRDGETQNAPRTDIQNPADLRSALLFAGLFAGTLFLVSWINNRIGMAGVYATAFIAGLTDLDAISLSSLRLLNVGRATAPEAALTIIIAFMANLIVKFGISALAGSRQMGRLVGGGFAAMTLGMAMGWGISMVF